MNANDFAGIVVLGYCALMVIGFVIYVMVTRWVLRINTIVMELKGIRESIDKSFKSQLPDQGIGAKIEKL